MDVSPQAVERRADIMLLLFLAVLGYGIYRWLNAGDSVALILLAVGIGGTAGALYSKFSKVKG